VVNPLDSTGGHRATFKVGHGRDSLRIFTEATAGPGKDISTPVANSARRDTGRCSRMQAVFREAGPADVDGLVRLRWEMSLEQQGRPAEAFDSFSERCGSFLRETLAGGKWGVWVAEVDGNLVAHIYVQLIDKVPRPGRAVNKYAYMTAVYTSPRFRGEGIGGELLRRACAWAEGAGAEFIIVWPAERAVDFYSRAGFVPSSEPMERELRPGR